VAFLAIARCGATAVRAAVVATVRQVAGRAGRMSIRLAG
jgi:hypothetical protein